MGEFETVTQTRDEVSIKTYIFENLVIGDVACTTLRHTTMFTYCHANTPLSQSECAYYLSYLIIKNIVAFDSHLFFMGPLNVGSNGFGAPAKKKMCSLYQSGANTVEMKKVEAQLGQGRE